MESYLLSSEQRSSDALIFRVMLLNLNVKTAHSCYYKDLREIIFHGDDTFSSQVELYCHSATCVDIQWNEMSCLTGPRCYMNTDIQQ